MSQMYYPGDKVRIRSDLKMGTSYYQNNQSRTCIPAHYAEMEFAGKIVTIERCIGHDAEWYFVDEDSYIDEAYRRAFIVDEMIESRVDEPEIDADALMCLLTEG